jgi:pyruvate/2-oxoglutarate dehydrogenase complex dihydrolipoamide acyltransferase (E2) component
MGTTATTDRNLSELETTIASGFTQFIEVGNALLEIQARKLYQDDGYATFEQYCARRWSISRSQAYRMIQAAEVVGHLSEDRAVPLPIHEAQTRVLARLKEPEAIRSVWEEVVDEYGETAATPKVRDAVDYHAAIAENPQRAAWPRDEVIAAYRQAQKREPAAPAALTVSADGDDDREIIDAPARPVATGRAEESAEAPPTLSIRDVHNRISAGRQLLVLDPTEWATRMDGATATDMQTLVADLRQWCDRMESALGYTLHDQ